MLRARDNPFASHRLEALPYRLQGATWDDLFERWEGFGRRGALVAPEGHGKSRCLDEMARRFQAAGRPTRRLTLRRGDRRLSEGQRQAFLDELRGDEVLLLDGSEQLSGLAWRRLRRASRDAGGLVITSHRPGRLPTLLRCATSPELLAELVAELTGSERCSIDLDELHRRHAGDLRAAFWELYDRWPEPPRLDSSAAP